MSSETTISWFIPIIWCFIWYQCSSIQEWSVRIL